MLESFPANGNHVRQQNQTVPDCPTTDIATLQNLLRYVTKTKLEVNTACLDGQRLFTVLGPSSQVLPS